MSTLKSGVRGNNFDKEQIRVQLQLLDANFDVLTVYGAMDIFHVKEYFLSLSHGQRSHFLQFILVVPVTNARSERLFTVLRYLKSYLRTTTLQGRLNYLMLLHVHKE